MLALQSTTPQKCTPNLLPARLNHNGPIPSTRQYWKPTINSAGKPDAYFRGRHLHGTSLPLPENYTGSVLHITDKNAPESQSQSQKNNERAGDDEDMDGEEEEETVEVKIAEKVGEFDEVVVWGHGEPVDEGQDGFVRGLREWVGFAEAMHLEEDEQDGKKTG